MSSSRLMGTTFLRGVLALMLGVVALMMFAPTAKAEERVCRGTIGAVTVDNLRVPAYAKCVLSGTQVKGTVKVDHAANLYAYGVRVNGNVRSQGFKNVYLARGASGGTSFVGGSVQLKNGLVGGVGSIGYTYVKGNVRYEANRARMFAGYSRVLTNLEAVGNKGGVQIVKNNISQKLGCKNTPPPTGGGNTAGDKEGQCAAL